jgi:hypothetical protein
MKELTTKDQAQLQELQDADRQRQLQELQEATEKAEALRRCKEGPQAILDRAQQPKTLADLEERHGCGGRHWKMDGPHVFPGRVYYEDQFYAHDMRLDSTYNNKWQVLDYETWDEHLFGTLDEALEWAWNKMVERTQADIDKYCEEKHA